MNLLDTLTRAADEEQLRLQPLPRHALAERDEHLRLHYALLLAALLHAQPATSEAQTRLLRLLLDALQLGDIRAALFEQARALSPEPLLEAARLLREAQCAAHLLLDALVLLRLDAPLGDDTVRLLGELASFLGLSDDELARRSADASAILGLHDTTPAQASTTSTAASAQLSALAAAAQAAKAADPPAAKASSKTGVQGATKADTQAGTQAAPSPGETEVTPLPELVAQLWPGALSQPLSTAALRQGLQGGLWVLEADLDVDFPWQANDAILVFRNAATLNTFAKEGEIKLADCRLVDAVLGFQGACSITLERCDWRGNYAPEAKHTALSSRGQALIVTDCQFSTRNARTILVQNNRLTLTGSCFTHCGHEELDGGAVWHSDHERVITNCHFDRCLAARGGAIWVNNLWGLSKCEFIACKSLLFQNNKAGDVAVFANKNSANPVLTQSVFRQTSVNVGDSLDGRGRQIAVDCQFIEGSLYFRRNDNHVFDLRCTFDRGCVIEASI